MRHCTRLRRQQMHCPCAWQTGRIRHRTVRGAYRERIKRLRTNERRRRACPSCFPPFSFSRSATHSPTHAHALSLPLPPSLNGPAATRPPLSRFHAACLRLHLVHSLVPCLLCHSHTTNLRTDRRLHTPPPLPPSNLRRLPANAVVQPPGVALAHVFARVAL